MRLYRGSMEVTCLVGNGSSIVYNDLLRIGPLTDGIVEAFSELAGTDAGDALAGFAHQVTGDARSDFEGLLGPLDTITQALPALVGTTAPFESVDWVAQPLNAATAALRRLHRLGLATALGLIATRAFGQGQDALDAGAGTLMNQLQEVANGDLLTVGTLNYDGLLHAVLPDDRVADLATGLAAGPVELIPGVHLESWPLRSAPDFPEDRDIHLLHLHGSLGWLRCPDGPVRKFRIDDLRSIDFWARLAQGQVNADPVVVLTDRKEATVGAEPFALAYLVLGRRLSTARHWCIAGYSFRDSPLNQALSDAVAARRTLGLPEPRLLVLGLGAVQELEERVREVLGDATPELFIDGEGLPGSVGGNAWQLWQEA